MLILLIFILLNTQASNTSIQINNIPADQDYYIRKKDHSNKSPTDKKTKRNGYHKSSGHSQHKH